MRQLDLDDEGTDLRRVRFAVVDVETTGANATVDEITEIALVVVEGGRTLAHLQSLVRTTRPIPPSIVALTGIANELVARAPQPAVVMDRLLPLLEGAVLVGHNVRFDRAFLEHTTSRLGLPWPAPPVIDTLSLARALLDGEARSFRLGALAASLGLPTPTHRAMADVRTTVALLHHLIGRAGDLGITTLEELASLRRRPPEGARSLQHQARRLPHRAGVYYFRHPHGVLYVGMATDLQTRVRSYFASRDERRKVGRLLRRATEVWASPIECPLQRALVELSEIQRHRPPFNEQGVRRARVRWHATPSGRQLGPWPQSAPPPTDEELRLLDGDPSEASRRLVAWLAHLAEEMQAAAARDDFEHARALRDHASVLATRTATTFLEEAHQRGTVLEIHHGTCEEPHQLTGPAGLLELGPPDQQARAARIALLLRHLMDDDVTPTNEDTAVVLAAALELLQASQRFQRRGSPAGAQRRQRRTRSAFLDR